MLDLLQYYLLYQMMRATINDRSLYRERYRHQRNHDENYPKSKTRLSCFINQMTTKQILENIALIKKKQDISQLLNQIYLSQELTHQGLATIFLTTLSKKIEECFTYIQGQGINLSDQIQQHFLESVYMIFRKMPIKISFDLFSKIWETLEKTNQFLVFHKYASVITSVVLYSSMKQFGKTANATMKQILLKLENAIKCLNSLQPEQIDSKELEFTLFKNYSRLNEEQKLVIKFHLIRLLQMLQKQNKSSITQTQVVEKFQAQVLQLAKQQKLKIFFETISHFPNMCKKLYSKISSQFINFSMNIQKKSLVGKQQIFCPQSINLENIKLFLQDEDGFSKDINVHLHQNKVYCKFNLELLQIIEQNIIKLQESFKIDNIFSLKVLIIKLFSLQKHEFIFINEGSENIIPTRQFICKIIQIMTKYLYINGRQAKNQDIQNCFNQDFIQLFFKNLFEWSENENERNLQYSIETLGDIISFSSYYTYKNIQKNKQTCSKLLQNSIKLIMKYNKIPNNWRIIKHLRLLIETQMTFKQDLTQNIKCLTHLFFDSFFSQDFTFIKGSHYVFLDKVNPNANYCQLFSQLVLKRVEKFAMQIKSTQNFHENELKSHQFNTFIFKLNLLALGAFKFTNAAQIAKICQEIYVKHANHLNWIYPLRTWIIHNCPQVEYEPALLLIKEIKQKIINMKFLFKPEGFEQFLQKFLLPNQHQNQEFNELLYKMAQMQNLLDLKQVGNQLSKQAYFDLVHWIIKPLSKWCGQVYKSVLAKDKNHKQSEFKQKIYKNFFLKNKSVYRRVHQSFKKLQTTLRVYICNIQKTINFRQAQDLSCVIGQLINQYASSSKQAQLINLRLIKNILGLQILEFKSHLTVKQILSYSIAYEPLKYSINNSMPRFMLFNIEIPLFYSIRSNFSFIIAQLTSQKRKQRSERQNFEYILYGKNIQELFQKSSNKKIMDVIQAQKSAKAALILKKVFLPSLFNKNKKNLQNIGFSLYLSQIKLAFQSEICEQYIQDHMQQILNIFKHKNSRHEIQYQNEYYSDDEDYEAHLNAKQPKQQQLTQFGEYDIIPIQFNVFKEEISMIVKKYLSKFPTLFFNQKAQNLLVSLKSIVSFVKEISMINKHKTQNHDQSITVDYLIVKLLQRGKEVYQTFYQTQKQLRNAQMQNNQHDTQTVQTIQTQIQNQEDQELTIRQRIMKKLKQRESNRRTKSESNLYGLFNVLAFVNKNAQKLIKKCFLMGIQTDLLEFLPIANKNQGYEINQVCQFIQITLPTIYKTSNKDQIQAVVSYYRLVLSTIEKLKLKNLDKFVPLIVRIIEQVKNFSLIELQQFQKEIITRIKKIVFRCFQLPYKMSRSNLGKIINCILNTSTPYLKRKIEFQVRNFIYSYYKKSDNLKLNQGKHSVQTIINPDHIEIDIAKFKNQFQHYLLHCPETFSRIVRGIIQGWKQSNYSLVYESGLQRLTRFSEDGFSFVEFYPPSQIQNIIKQIIKQFTRYRILGTKMVLQRTEKVNNAKSQQERDQINKIFYRDVQKVTKNMHNYLEVLEQVMCSNQLLIPFISSTLVQDSKGQKVTFLDFIIDVCIEENIDSMINFLTMFLNTNGLYINIISGLGFSKYVASKIAVKILSSLKNQKQEQKINQIVYLTSVCLGFKVFNSLSGLQNEENQSLTSRISNLLCESQANNSSPLKLLYQQCLYLIIRHSQLQRLKNKNCLVELTQSSQFINQKLFLISQDTQIRSRKLDYSDDQFEQIRRYRQEDTLGLMAVKTKQSTNSKQNKIVWKSLNHVLQTIEQYLNVKFQQKTQIQAQMPEKDNQIYVKRQIIVSALSQYFKIVNSKKNLQHSRRQIRRRRRVQKIVKTICINQKRQLSKYYQNLRHLLPASKYRVPKKDSKYINLELADDSYSQNQECITVRSQLDMRTQSQQERNFFHNFEQRTRTQTFTNKELIQMLESVKANSEQIAQKQNLLTKNKEQLQKEQDLQKLQIPLAFKLSKTKSMKQQNIMVKRQQNLMVQANQRLEQKKEEQTQQPILSQKLIKLLENENYKKYDKMAYAQRIQFLINEADDQFFMSLPSQVSTQIRQQALLLRNQRARLQSQKIIDERYSQRSFGHRIGRRCLKKVQIQKVKYEPLLQDQQINIPKEVISNILKCLFIKATTKSQGQRRGRSGNQLNCGKGVSMLLQTKKFNTKFKVLTTLLLIIKNLQKLTILYFQKNQDEQWMKAQKSIGLTLHETKQKFATEILKLIKHSIDESLFNNDDLILMNIDSKDYYSQILPIQQVVGFETQNQILDIQNQNIYSPFNQILGLALDYDHQFASILLKKSGNISKSLAIKIFDLMKNNKITSERFYQNLKSIQNNQTIINLFRSSYSLENPPSFELLGKILRYKFGELQYAKQLHMKAFLQYKKTYNEYLVEIFRLYTIPQLQAKQPELLKLKKIYSNIVQELYNNGQNIKQSPLYKIIDLPELLDFKTKKAIFRADEIFDINYSLHGIELLIDLDNIFASSYNQIMRLEPSQIQQSIKVKFSKSTSHGSGMFKTLVQLLYKQMFNPETGMFAVVQLDGIYQPSKVAAYSNPEYLNCFKFLGRILGICLLQDQIFPAFFTSTFYKMLLNKLPSWEDLKQVNNEIFLIIRGLVECRKQYPQAQIKGLGDPIMFFYKGKDMTFSDIEYPLKQNGKNIQVCNQNLDQYIELMTRSLLIDFCQKQYSKIKQGFNQIVPTDKISMFNSEDLQKLISGVSNFDRKQFQQCCEIHGFKKEDQQIEWFWKYVNQCSKQELVDLVEYFYGMCKLPAGGFSSIHVSIQRLNEVNTFPRASLCGKLGVLLPKYTSYEIFVQKFEQAKVLAQKGRGLMEH